MNTYPKHTLDNTLLNKPANYAAIYTPDLLFPIPRSAKRAEIGLAEPLPFKGYDEWNGYELSWLNEKGKPIVMVGRFLIPCTSSNIIESKSFKLYLNSFNNTQFKNNEEVKNLLKADLTKNCGAEVSVELFDMHEFNKIKLTTLTGICLDEQDISCDTYTVNPDYLIIETAQVTETVYSNLLKSNCLVTEQPDWGSIQISYSGKKINHAGLLQYIVSFRNHNEFHEQCVERIFADIMQRCAPHHLTVAARYTRRGGLDINPYRTTDTVPALSNIRLFRQ